VRPLDQLTWLNLRRAIEIFSRTAWRGEVCCGYRKKFWKMTRRELRQGHVEADFQIAMVVHYLQPLGVSASLAMCKPQPIPFAVVRNILKWLDFKEGAMKLYQGHKCVCEGLCGSFH
jgi:hypothetical protein